MNKNLTSNIIQHILSNFVIIPSSFVNKEGKSLQDKDYLLDKKIIFDLENDDEIIENINDTLGALPVAIRYSNIYGAQINYADQEIKVLFSRIDFDEYFMVVQSKGAPSYGLYLCSQQEEDERYPITFYIDPLIAFSLDGKSWMECQTYLQATFLAAMEQTKDLGLLWKKCLDYQDQYEQLISFIKFKDQHFEG